MDNITHSLAGSLIATGVVHLRARNAAHERRPLPSSLATAAVVTGIVGANLPDIDVPWNALMEAIGRQDAIGSMLQHRGYTHSLLAAVVWTALLWMLGNWWTSRRATADVRAHTRGSLLLVAALSVLSHVSLDFTNSYGVHPLSPVVDRWFYGDTVFIIEPWLWVLSAAALLRTARRRAARVGLALVLLLAVGLSWIAPQVTTVPALLVTLGAVGAVVCARRSSPRRATAFGIGGWLGVTAAFAIGTAAVRTQVRQSAESMDRTDTGAGAEARVLRDVIVSPYPANPLCARVETVESGATQYRVATAWAAAFPGIVSAAWCARAVDANASTGAQSVRMQRIPNGDTQGVRWGWSWSAPRAELLRLATGNCQVAAWMQFARAPFWRRNGDGSIQVGDMRYDRDQGVTVALFTIPASAPACPVPAWRPPRLDVWPELTTLLPTSVD